KRGPCQSIGTGTWTQEAGSLAIASPDAKARTWYGATASMPMTAVPPVAAIRLPAVMPAAEPGRATRFQPAHKWIRFVCRTTPNAVREPGAVPFVQKPRPGTSENDAASVGIAEDQPTPPAQAS